MPKPQPDSEPGSPAAGPSTAPRPESLLLAFFGAYLLGRDSAVPIGSVISVLGRLGVGEHAVRAVLKRMAQRGLLRTARQGRQAYICLTSRARVVLQKGADRLDAGVADRSWDGRWTLLTFSVPESRREDRHALRTRLRWAGFGLLRSGLWIAPRGGDVAGTLDELALLEYVRTFRAEAITPDDPRLLASEAWDLTALAKGYRGFLSRWESGAHRAFDELCARVLLEAEWLLLIRDDPRLPLVLLPEDWPGIRAEKEFCSLRRKLRNPADTLAETTLGCIPLPAGARAEEAEAVPATASRPRRTGAAAG